MSSREARSTHRRSRRPPFRLLMNVTNITRPAGDRLLSQHLVTCPVCQATSAAHDDLGTSAETRDPVLVRFV